MDGRLWHPELAADVIECVSDLPKVRQRAIAGHDDSLSVDVAEHAIGNPLELYELGTLIGCKLPRHVGRLLRGVPLDGCLWIQVMTTEQLLRRVPPPPEVGPRDVLRVHVFLID